MLQQLQSAQKVVGFKQSLRAIRDGQAAIVFVADDAEDKIKEPIHAACREKALTPIAVPAMATLGEACGIHIGAACAVILV